MAVFIVVACILTGVLIVIAARLQRSLRKYRIHRTYAPYKEAPSVSVCIPARNEMHAMTQCLERVLASDYEKLEVIVFDDSSADDTSILIRSFAHAGVRFVPGTKLPEGWLGKNYALDVLAREASGTYVIFLDVDTYIQPTTISQLVGCMTTENLDMLSVLPSRCDTWRASVLFGSLRYFWQLVLARARYPATSSSVWMITRATLLSTLGGLALYKNEVQPETAIATRLSSSYWCLIANEDLGVSFEKKWKSQMETSRRLLYPMVGGSWLSAFGAIIVLVLLNVPSFTLLSTIVFGWTEMQIMALWLLGAFTATYGVYTSYIWQRNWWLGALLWPAVIFQELGLFIASLWGYAHHSITWKGRLVHTSLVQTNNVEIDQ